MAILYRFSILDISVRNLYRTAVCCTADGTVCCTADGMVCCTADGTVCCTAVPILDISV